MEHWSSYCLVKSHCNCDKSKLQSGHHVFFFVGFVKTRNDKFCKVCGLYIIILN
jgi:hypothetical protein